MNAGSTFLREFMRCVEAYPLNMAAGDAKGYYSYAELGKYSESVAGRILALRSESQLNRAAVMLPRVKQYMAAVIGTMEAGFAYVPIDPGYPDERIRFILGETAARVVITDKATKSRHSALFGEMDKNHVPVLCMDEITADYDPSDSGFSREAFIDYFSDRGREEVVFYTSGTTGNPKGVIHGQIDIENDAVAEYCAPVGCHSRFACMGKFTYIASEMFLFPPLKKGGSVYIINEDEMSSYSSLASVIRRERITAMSMPSKLAISIVERYPDLGLEYLLVTGRMGYIPDTRFPIYETYGSTESSHVLVFKLDGESNAEIMGKPLEGIELYLIDESGLLIEQAGVTGELCVFTPYASHGYINRPEQEKEKFREMDAVPGKILCCTGDLMEWVETKSGKGLRFLGRKDNMVKINGQRVEPEEVERKLLELNLVEDALCRAVSISGTDSLCCYYVRRDALEKQPDVRLFIDALSRTLPAYMIPSLYKEVAEIPRTPNGKIDRRADMAPMDLTENPEKTSGQSARRASLAPNGRDLLQPLQMTGCQAGSQAAAMPSEETGIISEGTKSRRDGCPNSDEAIICRIIGEILDIEGISPDDDLMTLGMNSLMLMKVADALEKNGFGLRPSDIMRCRTIRRMSEASKRMAWFYKDFNAALPTICYLCGVTVVSFHHPRLEALSAAFNVLVIEPVQSHFEMIFDCYDFDELILFYTGLVDAFLPADARLAGFMGNSFGGDIAVNMARLWRESKGYAAPVIMGDTYIGFCGGPFTVEDILNDPVNRLEDSPEEQVYYLNIVYYLNCSRKRLHPYSGHVLYLEAMTDNNVMGEDEKIGLARGLFEDVEIMPLPDISHYELSTSAELAAFFLKTAEKTFIKNHASRHNSAEHWIYNAAKAILGDGPLSVDDDLLAAGLNNLGITRLSSVLCEHGMNVRPSDIMRYRTIRNLAGGMCRLAWLYEPYDEAKPTVVIACGVIMVDEAMGLIRAFSVYFNVLVIEPLYEHFDLLFDSFDFDEIAGFYADEIENILGENAQLCGFFGISFGGDLAYSLAVEWEKRTGIRTSVLMGDTYVGILMHITAEKIRKNARRLTVPAEVVAERINMVYNIDTTRQILRRYDGHVAFLNTTRDDNPDRRREKLERIKFLFKDLCIIDMPEKSHEDLYLLPQAIPDIIEAALLHLMPK